MYAEFTLAMKNSDDAAVVYDRVIAEGLNVNAHKDTVLGNEFPYIAFCHGELSDDISAESTFIGQVTNGIEYLQIGT